MEATHDGTVQAERAGGDYASERGADFDAKREAYEAARKNLARLYDNPDKTVPVHLYRGRLKRSQQAVVKAHAAWIAADA